MILLHGNGEDHSIFAETAEILKEHFAVYMPDTRGHGRSEGVEEYHYSDMAEDLRELIRVLGLERPLLCGFSDGGIVGLLAAVRDPGLLSAMVLCGANLTPKGMKTRWYAEGAAHYGGAAGPDPNSRAGHRRQPGSDPPPGDRAHSRRNSRQPSENFKGRGSRKLYRPLRKAGGASGGFFLLTRTGRFGRK